MTDIRNGLGMRWYGQKPSIQFKTKLDKVLVEMETGQHVISSNPKLDKSTYYGDRIIQNYTKSYTLQLGRQNC